MSNNDNKKNMKQNNLNTSILKFKIFSILDKQSLNTSKNLNYIMLRQAYDLYFNRESIKVSMELPSEKKNDWS